MDYGIRYPDDRPNIVELQSHPFFKQVKRTTLSENLSLTGIDKYNCTKLSSGKTIQVFLSQHSFQKIQIIYPKMNLQMRTSVCRVRWPTWTWAVSLNGIFKRRRRRLNTQANEKCIPDARANHPIEWGFENAQQASIIDITLSRHPTLSLSVYVNKNLGPPKITIDSIKGQIPFVNNMIWMLFLVFMANKCTTLPKKRGWNNKVPRKEAASECSACS